MLQCVAVCCRVRGGGERPAGCRGCEIMQCVAVCCSVLQRVTVCYKVLQCVAVCCRVGGGGQTCWV